MTQKTTNPKYWVSCPEKKECHQHVVRDESSSHVWIIKLFSSLTSRLLGRIGCREHPTRLRCARSAYLKFSSMAWCSSVCVSWAAMVNHRDLWHQSAFKVDLGRGFASLTLAYFCSKVGWFNHRLVTPLILRCCFACSEKLRCRCRLFDGYGAPILHHVSQETLGWQIFGNANTLIFHVFPPWDD